MPGQKFYLRLPLQNCPKEGFPSQNYCPELEESDIFLPSMPGGGFSLSPAQLSPWITSEHQTSPAARKKELKELICSWGPQWGLCNSSQLSKALVCQQKDITKLLASKDARGISAHWNKSVPIVCTFLYKIWSIWSHSPNLLAVRSCCSGYMHAFVANLSLFLYQ